MDNPRANALAANLRCSERMLADWQATLEMKTLAGHNTKFAAERVKKLTEEVIAYRTLIAAL